MQNIISELFNKHSTTKNNTHVGNQITDPIITSHNKVKSLFYRGFKNPDNITRLSAWPKKIGTKLVMNCSIVNNSLSEIGANNMKKTKISFTTDQLNKIETMSKNHNVIHYGVSHICNQSGARIE